jgi:hypothetical protein
MDSSGALRVRFDILLSATMISCRSSEVRPKGALQALSWVDYYCTALSDGTCSLASTEAGSAPSATLRPHALLALLHDLLYLCINIWNCHLF